MPLRRLATLCALLLVACAPSEQPPAPIAEPVRVESPTPSGPIADARGDPAAFALNLYRVLGREPGNVFISPESISTAFAMAYGGARGATADQMARTFGFTGDQAAFHAAMGARLKQAQTDAPGARLTIANAMWVQQSFPLHASYSSLLRDHYEGGLQQVDFLRRPEAAAATINAWVKARTNGRIEELIRREIIHEEVKLVLTNAIWFKGDWRDPFPAAATREGPFRTPAGPRPSPLMQRQGYYRHYDGGAFQAVELPYQGETLSMLVFLPKAADGLPAFEAQLDAANMTRWLQALSTAQGVPVVVTLPRFTVRDRYELKRPLTTMGMGLPFSRMADFSGVTDAADLLIDEAVHQSFVAVDEQGTEAAAATGILMAPVSVPPPPVQFRADHPFFYVIRDNRSGALLFMGRLETPEG